jgi:RNA polymerase sigma-70 factor (ECF subfamily)
VISIEESRLVLKAQEGSLNAIDQLLRRYQRPLFRHIQRMLRSDDDAYDALQQTFISVVKSLRNLRSREQFRPFAFGVASRVCLKALSRRKRQRENVDSDEDYADTAPSPEILRQFQEQRDALLEQVKALSPKVRSVILLHFYEGLSLLETAAALEINLGTAKSRLGAGLAKLRVIEEVKNHV